MELPSERPGESFDYQLDVLSEYDDLLEDLSSRYPTVAEHQGFFFELVETADDVPYAKGLLLRILDVN